MIGFGFGADLGTPRTLELFDRGVEFVDPHLEVNLDLLELVGAFRQRALAALLDRPLPLQGLLLQRLQRTQKYELTISGIKRTKSKYDSSRRFARKRSTNQILYSDQTL